MRDPGNEVGEQTAKKFKLGQKKFTVLSYTNKCVAYDYDEKYSKILALLKSL